MDRPADRVALIELLDRDGAVHRSIDVLAWPITLGRDLGNDVVLDDPHLAAQHARLDRAEDGTVLLRVGDCLNGALLAGRPLAAGQQAALDGPGLFQLGLTRLRLRLPGEVLAAERPLPQPEASWANTWALLVALGALLTGPAWLAMDPGTEGSAWLPIVLGTPVALALWCALWALASKLFQHRFDFRGHVGVMLRVLVPCVAASLLLPVLAGALDWPALWQASQWVQPVTLALLVWRHGLRVLPGHARAVGAGVAGLLVLSLGSVLAMNQQRFERLNRSPYMTSLPLPPWRWHTPIGVPQFLDEARPLESQLQGLVSGAKADEADDDEGDASP